MFSSGLEKYKTGYGEGGGKRTLKRYTDAMKNQV
jgi:hypothetical protein